jgi:hypothetical protein
LRGVVDPLAFDSVIACKAGWSWGCVSAIDSNGRTIWIADAHRGVITLPSISTGM